MASDDFSRMSDEDLLTYLRELDLELARARKRRDDAASAQVAGIMLGELTHGSVLQEARALARKLKAARAATERARAGAERVAWFRWRQRRAARAVAEARQREWDMLTRAFREMEGSLLIAQGKATDAVEAALARAEAAVADGERRLARGRQILADREAQLRREQRRRPPPPAPSAGDDAGDEGCDEGGGDGGAGDAEGDGGDEPPRDRPRGG